MTRLNHIAPLAMGLALGCGDSSGDDEDTDGAELDPACLYGIGCPESATGEPSAEPGTTTGGETPSTITGPSTPSTTTGDATGSGTEPPAPAQWDDIRCYDIGEGTPWCYGGLGGLYVLVSPQCAVEAFANDPDWREIEGDPGAVACGSPTGAAGWDRVRCFEADGIDPYCFAALGDWWAQVAAECQLDLSEAELVGPDPFDHLCGAGSGAGWDEFVCWQVEGIDPRCYGRRGNLWAFSILGSGLISACELDDQDLMEIGINNDC